MEDSILISTKKMLGLDKDYRAFDVDVITSINSAFSTLNDLGIGPKQGFAIDGDEATWSSFMGNDLHLNSVKTYVYLKVRMVFDPPTMSFHIEAMNEQIREHEWRLAAYHDSNVVNTN